MNKELKMEKQNIKKNTLSGEEKKILLEEYKLVIQTQMHFNEMLMKCRVLAFTIVTSLAALGLYLLKGDININEKIIIFGYAINISGLLVSFIFILWLLVGLVDYCYYFRLLLGAVERSKNMEENVFGIYKPKNEFLGLTSCINKMSPEWVSHLMIILFYIIPFLLGCIIAYHLLINVGAEQILIKKWFT